MVDSFLKFLAYEKRYSKHTISSYSNDLSQFFTFIHQFDEDLLVENVDYAVVRAWIVSLVEQGITPRSINRKISTLRTFFKFLMRNGIIERDPTFNIKILKTKKDTVGIRVPDHIICQTIIQELGHPIMSTSLPMDEDVEYFTDPEIIHDLFEKQVDMVIDSGIGNMVGSTIIDCTSDFPELIREGAGPWKDLW